MTWMLVTKMRPELLCAVGESFDVIAALNQRISHFQNSKTTAKIMPNNLLVVLIGTNKGDTLTSELKLTLAGEIKAESKLIRNLAVNCSTHS